MNRNFFALAACVAAVSLCTTAAVAALPGPAGFSFAKGAKFTVAGYAAGKPTLSGFPVLVRLQANAPVGFSYADLQNSATDADLCFVDMDGNGLPFEIDTWNASGESLVWVRLPTMTNGAEFVMCWGSSSSGKVVCGESPFSGYVGVWHMSEASGTVADSSGNGFAATPSGTAAATASVAVDGPVGNGRQCSTALGADNLSYLSVPSYDSKGVGDTFAVSGWVSVGSGQTGGDNDARLFSRKEDWQNTHGWEVLWKTAGEIRVRGAASGDNIKLTGNNYKYAGQGWKHVFVVYDGKNSVFYENGTQKGSKTNGTAATENGMPLAIGGYANDKGSQLVGSVDECRLLDAVPSAAWAKAEYDSMADPAFLTAAAAEAYGEIVDLSAGVAVAAVGFTNATVSVSVQALGGGAVSADVLVQLAAAADFAAPLWSTNYTVHAAGAESIPIAGLATNATCWVRALVTNDLFDAVTAGPASFTTLAPGAPTASGEVSGRTASSLAVSGVVQGFGTGSDAATARLEASTDGFATVAAFAEAALAAPGSLSMEVAGLSPFTAYALRLRVANSWGVETLVDLGSATTLPASGLAELYVDSLGTGNGLSPESALPTIRAALDIAGPGCTIWVCGGEGRAYGVTNETDTLTVPADLEGLSIRAYGETPGDGGRATFAVSDTYIEDGGTSDILTIAAADVTLAGFTCSYGPRSLGRQNVGSCLFIAVAAPRFTLADCEFFCTGIPGYAGSGANGIVAAVQVGADWHAATGMVVERCFFHDTTGYRGDTAPQPLRVATGTTIRECVFSNAWRIVTDPGPGKTKFNDFTFVSNVVHSGPMRDASYFSFPHGLFSSGYGGLGGGAEIAYNVFVGTGEANRGIIGLARWDGLGGSERFHHNVVRNFGWVWGFNRGDNAPTGKTVAEIFDNVFDLMDGGTIVRDEGFDGETPRVGTPIFHTGSFSRNNAIVASGAFWGGASALAEDYDRSVVSPLDDIAIDEPPDWVCTNDLFHADFYRYRTSRTATPDLGVLAWRGENNEYPLWIGAKPPLYPSATMLILR